jgi:hypothetical protein
MSEKKLKILTIASLLIITTLSVYFINQPLTNSLIKKQKVDIVILSRYSSLISLLPDGKIIIKTIKKDNKKRDISIKQRANEVYLNFEKELKKDIFYIAIDEKKINEIHELIYVWKKRMIYAVKLLKVFLNLETNLSIADKLNLIPLAINASPSNIIFLNSYDAEKNKELSQKQQITVELIASKTDKNEVKKVIEKLKKENIDIIEQKISNSYSQTQIIINRMDNFNKAQKVMEILNIKTPVVIEKSFMVGDVRVIISKDYGRK